MFRLLFIPLLKTVLVVALLVAGLVILIGRLGRRSEKKQLPPVSDDSGEVRKQEEDARKAVLLAEEERNR